MKTSIPIPNSIIFIYDVDGQVIIPDYIDRELIAFNSSCISVGTQSEFDGDVLLHLEKNENKGIDKFIKKFSGMIDTPNKKIAISTSDTERVLECAVDNYKTLVTIWVDDNQFPSVVVVHTD